MSEKRKRNNAVIFGLIIAYILIYFIFIFRLIPNSAPIINGGFIIVLAITSYFMYGFQHCGLNKIRKKVILEVLTGIILYFALIYILGQFTGFMKNAYSLKLMAIIKNSILPLISVIAFEIFRYIFISANKDSKEIIIYYTIALILLDIVINFYGVSPTLVAVFIYLSVKVIPMIFKNVVLSYLTYQVGYHPCILYVIPLCLYKFIMPYIPNLGNYLYAIIDVTLPSLIYIYAAKMVTNNLREENSTWELVKTFVINIPVTIIFIVFVILIAGVFKFQLLGIDTSAISPKIKRGDAVIINKKIKYENYKEGDIIVYKGDKKLIIDQISKKDKDEDGNVILYITTEYNEDEEDTYQKIDEEQLVGKYNGFKISKIAYPTIWFKDIIKGDVHEN